jgi:hypothetical protein
MAAREMMLSVKQEFWDMTEKYQRTIRIFELVLKCGDLVKDARDDQAYLVRDYDAFMRTGLVCSLHPDDPPHFQLPPSPCNILTGFFL